MPRQGLQLYSREDNSKGIKHSYFKYLSQANFCVPHLQADIQTCTLAKMNKISIKKVFLIFVPSKPKNLEA